MRLLRQFPQALETLHRIAVIHHVETQSHLVLTLVNRLPYLPRPLLHRTRVQAFIQVDCHR